MNGPVLQAYCAGLLPSALPVPQLLCVELLSVQRLESHVPTTGGNLGRSGQWLEWDRQVTVAPAFAVSLIPILGWTAPSNLLRTTSAKELA